MDAEWRDICASAALTEGKLQRFLVQGFDLLVVRVAGMVHATDNLCTHADACLHEGRLRGHRIICPLHGASFDVRSGAVLAKPAIVALQRYEAREAQGKVLVLLPTVDTFSA